MKAKVFTKKITSCFDCPHAYIHEDYKYKDKCMKTNKRIYNLDKINKFCPLEGE